MNTLRDPRTNKPIPESAWCAVPWNESGAVPLNIVIASTVVAFIIPVTLVTMLYFK